MTAKNYKRSWKNLLLNKRYQLRFTLFMVGMSVALMSALGWWVMKEADEATKVGINGVSGTKCVDVPSLVDEARTADEPPPVPMKLDPHGAGSASASMGSASASMGSASAGSAGAGSAGQGSAGTPSGSASTPTDSAGSAEPARHGNVQMTDESIMLAPPTDFGDKVVAHWNCEAKRMGDVDALERGRTRILYVLVATGLLLAFGLAIYGIKMTHRVAGPLFKVSLYLAKMRDGRFDKVYNLRKGDQLVDFYDNFKAAHAGVVDREREDIARLAELVAAAEAAGAGDHAAIAELRAMLARKEKSLE